MWILSKNTTCSGTKVRFHVPNSFLSSHSDFKIAFEFLSSPQLEERQFSYPILHIHIADRTSCTWLASEVSFFVGLRDGSGR